MSRRITIDPITRLEGHGKIQISLDDSGKVVSAYLQAPDFRGFEKFCEGRAAEEMPTITQKICGVCPTAHHIASIKALDNLFMIDPPKPAKMIRELLYTAFLFEDHLLHFYFMGGPDFLAGPYVPAAKRNVLSLLADPNNEIVREALNMRKRVRKVSTMISGSALYPVFGLPGGVSKGLAAEEINEIQIISKEAVDFAERTLLLFEERVLKKNEYLDLLTGEAFFHRTYYMGLVDSNRNLSLYDGTVRVIDPDGQAFVEFRGEEYLNHLEERVEPFTYQKILYLKNVGWKGFVDGNDSGIYRVGPLARMNVSEGPATKLARAEYEKMLEWLGPSPVHNTLAYHWARLIEAMYAAERMNRLSQEAEISSIDLRRIPGKMTRQGVGVCEAPRGTLFHDYKTDSNALISELNLLVATQNNSAAINMSIEKAARFFAEGDDVPDSALNLVEMAFRAYDPCLACATH